MNDTCAHCKHFRRHYIRYSRGNYHALTYGHCVKPRRKKREADTPACAYFILLDQETAEG